MSRAAEAFETWTHVASFRSTRKGEVCVTAKNTPMGGEGKDYGDTFQIVRRISNPEQAREPHDNQTWRVNVEYKKIKEGK